MPKESLYIDGAQGEGGGQIIRTALALSAICNQPITVERIRANRDRPGLCPQHLKSVTAMGELCKAELSGARKGSNTITFSPTQLPSGLHTIDIKTAGSTALLLHALYFAMAWHPEGGQLTLIGGTHNDRVPTFDYLSEVWQPMMGLCGYQADLTCHAYGLYPKGGGELEISIPGNQRGQELQSFEWTQRPPIDEIRIHSLWTEPAKKASKRKPNKVPKRMARSAEQTLEEAGFAAQVVDVEHQPSASIGAICHVFVKMGPLRAGFTSFGKRGIPAEQVGRTAAQKAIAFLQSNACLEEHIADQVLLPLALSGKPSTFTTCFGSSKHLKTNAAIIEAFLPHIHIDFSPSPNPSVQGDEILVKITSTL